MHPFPELAKKAIEEYVLTGQKAAPPAPLPGEMEKKAGAFVSLHRNGHLRGCIGTIQPMFDNLAREIIENAISAATRDPRFPPVGADELDELEISVDVLSAPEPVASLKELDPREYGIIVTAGWRRGLLLPDLEGIDTTEEQIAICRRKANITPNEDIFLQKFTVERFR